jgi:hypothetical protein
MPVFVLVLMFIGGEGEAMQAKGPLLDHGEPVIFHSMAECKQTGMAMAQLITDPRFGLVCQQAGFDI